MTTADYVRERLHYDPATGVFTWKPKPELGWRDRAWNTKWAGKVAGTTDDRGYAQVNLDGVTHYAHRLAWLYVEGVWPPEEIDHRNRRRGSNTFHNLRPSSRSQNMANAGLSTRNKSGAKGVSRSARDGRWQAQIMVRGNRKFLGRHSTVEEAQAAYHAASIKYFGEFGAAS